MSMCEYYPGLQFKEAFLQVTFYIHIKQTVFQNDLPESSTKQKVSGLISSCSSLQAKVFLGKILNCKLLSDEYVCVNVRKHLTIEKKCMNENYRFYIRNSSFTISSKT